MGGGGGEVGLDAGEDAPLAFVVQWHRRNQPDQLPPADHAMPRKLMVECEVFSRPAAYLDKARS